jgi:integrase
MATLRKDGRWMSRAKHPATGKPIFGYGRTPEDADADLAAKLQALMPLTEPLLSLHDVAKALWWPTLDHVRPLTRKKYEGIYVNHIRPNLGAIAVKELTVQRVQAWINKLNTTGMGARTVAFCRDTLSRILNTAVAEGLLTHNVASHVRVPSPPRKRERVLTVADAGALFAATVGTELSAPVFLAAVLGLRRGEIAALRWSDLDRQRGELRILRQRQAIRPHGVIETELKTTESRRTLRLTPGIIEEIDRRGNLDHEYICTRAGAPWVPDTITEHWARVRDELKLSDWHFHDLRHGAAGLLYAAGCDMLQIAAVLGHSKPDMSLLYTDATKERRQQAVETLSESLGFGKFPVEVRLH